MVWITRTLKPRTDEQFSLTSFWTSFICSSVRQTIFFQQFFLEQFYEPACSQRVRILYVKLLYRSKKGRRGP